MAFRLEFKQRVVQWKHKQTVEGIVINGKSLIEQMKWECSMKQALDMGIGYANLEDKLNAQKKEIFTNYFDSLLEIGWSLDDIKKHILQEFGEKIISMSSWAVYEEICQRFGI